MTELQYSYCPYCGEELTEFDLRYRVQAADAEFDCREFRAYLEKFQGLSDADLDARSKVFGAVDILDLDFNDGGQPKIIDDVFRRKYSAAQNPDGEFQARNMSADAVCGKCQNIVPFEMPNLSLCKIAVIGGPKTGKTTMLASLLKSLGGNRKWNFFTYSPALRGCIYDPLKASKDGSRDLFVDNEVNPTIYQYYRNMFEKVDEERTIPDITKADQLPYPFLFKLYEADVFGKKYKDLCVALYDVPGELFSGDATQLEIAIKRIKGADALLWVVDPVMFPAVSLALGKKTNSKIKSSRIASEHYNLIEHMRDNVGDSVRDKKIALVVTKADVFLNEKVKVQLTDVDKENIIFKVPDKELELSMVKTEFDRLVSRSDNDIKNVLNSNIFKFKENPGDGFAEHMADRLKAEIKCFRASALGFDIPEGSASDKSEKKRLEREPEPYGLKEIFYWLLSECVK